jgi:phosphoglycolate phosphatase-like HAD superfamily hydrolase
MNSILPISFSGVNSIFFDFDGVLVDSVPLKLAAYREIFFPFGEEVVEEITKYHLENGGIDRYKKIEYILSKYSLPLSLKNQLADQFAHMVKEKVIQAPAIPSMIYLAKEMFDKIPLFIVSGTPEIELKEIVTQRKWDLYFKEIKGSPSSKVEITKMLLDQYSLTSGKSIFIGDATTDFHTAKECKMWFLGVPFS